MVHQIISGGQTGVDRTALDIALQQGIVCGGWVPRGRRAEDGVIPFHYQNLQETETDDPRERTERNVRDSDGTLIITRGMPAGGTAFTLELAARLSRPALHLDLERDSIPRASRQLVEWIQIFHPVILNIAGPRHSEDPEIYRLAKALLEESWRLWHDRNLKFFENW